MKAKTAWQIQRREPDKVLMERLQKQERYAPKALMVRDPELMRLLIIAGAGGTY